MRFKLRGRKVQEKIVTDWTLIMNSEVKVKRFTKVSQIRVSNPTHTPQFKDTKLKQVRMNNDNSR